MYRISMRSYFFSIALTQVAITLAACQTIPVEKIADNADPAQEIATTETQYDKVLKKQGDVLSPIYFEKAKSNLDDARRMRDRNDSSEDILEKVATARAYLKKTEETITSSTTVMPEVVEARANAVEAQAPQTVSEEFKKTDRMLKLVGEDLEDRDTVRAQTQRDDLKKRYLEMELQSIKIVTLNPTKTVVEQAMNEGAKENAPKTLSKSTNSIKEAEAYIDTSRHDKDGIQDHAQRAQADADLLLLVTRETKRSGGAESEDLVLTKLAQARTIVSQHDAAKAAASKQNAEKEATQGEMQSMQTENERLAADKAFNDKFIAAKAMFAADEADVYRDGDKLVLRLKSLGFPVGKSNLKSENYPVLGKVKEVALQIAPAEIVVEGHTDSTGNAEKNRTLSLDRARAVAEYLTANGLNIEGIKIETQGFGDQHPIAPNNTAAGRAQNRRVDVVIRPTQKELTH